MKKNKKTQMSLGIIFQIMIAFVLFSFLGVGFSLGIMSSGRESVEISDANRIHHFVFSALINNPLCFADEKNPGVIMAFKMVEQRRIENCLKKDETAKNYEILIKIFDPKDPGSVEGIFGELRNGLLEGEEARREGLVKYLFFGSGSDSARTSTLVIGATNAPQLQISSSASVNVINSLGEVNTYLMVLVTTSN